MSRRELLIGAGSRRDKILAPSPDLKEWQELVTLDINPDHKPDIITDLNITPWPLEDESFDEVHAYEVLEHLGVQGDAKSFFATFSEIYRILKPNGYLFATVPMWNNVWAWGDPSHTRIINQGSLAFLSQEEYKLQVGKSPMSDFRYMYKDDFNTVFKESKDGAFIFALQAVKPSRYDKQSKF